MKKLLLTGFVPFLTHKINPTEEIAKALDGQKIGNYEISGRVLPVDFAASSQELFKHFEEVKPDVVISLGLAAGRSLITPERIAINVNDGAADNNGIKLEDALIKEDGPDAYFSTLPIRSFVNGLREAGLPAKISNSAGTYLCNNVMYNMIHKIKEDNLDVRSGFVHIPASHDLALTEPQPSWSQTDLLEAVKVMINALDQ